MMLLLLLISDNPPHPGAKAMPGNGPAVAEIKARRLSMKKMSVAIIVICLFCTFLTFASASYADQWLDKVVSFSQPTGSSYEGGVAADALGSNSGSFVSIDIPEVLVLAFTDNTAYNGTGKDIKIYQVIGGDSNVDVYASKDNINYIYLGRTAYDVEYDLGTLAYANYLKFVGLDNGGSSAGFDLDAVEALHSGAPVPIPAAAWLLGSGLLGLCSIRRKIGK